MTPDDALTPVEIRAPRGARVLEIDWADGHTSVHPHRWLRGFCPCASCQGHHGPIRYREAGEPLLLDLSEVGNYALQLHWADGHDTGIYSFDFLRRLCACPRCAPEGLAGRTFLR